MGGLNFPFTKKIRTTEELIEENERLKTEAESEDLRRRIALSQADRKRLRDAGLTVEKDFGGQVTRALRWLNKTK